MLYGMVPVVFIVSMPCRLQHLGCLQTPGFELGSTWSPFRWSSGSACPAESGVEVSGFQSTGAGLLMRCMHGLLCTCVSVAFWMCLPACCSARSSQLQHLLPGDHGPHISRARSSIVCDKSCAALQQGL